MVSNLYDLLKASESSSLHNRRFMSQARQTHKALVMQATSPAESSPVKIQNIS